jgi:hypothetical protein
MSCMYIWVSGCTYHTTQTCACICMHITRGVTHARWSVPMV